MTLLAWSPSSVPRMRRLFRFCGIAILLCGAVLVLVALSVFLTQGSQIRVTAVVLSERCHPQVDLATGVGETRCDVAARFTTKSGQVINTTVTDAYRSEIRHEPGEPATIQLRYDSSDPSQPFKQSNYMSAGQFALVLGLGVLASGLGTLWLARAQRMAENAVRRRMGSCRSA
jgi:Protein of unknown function (DUF3592)